MPLPVTEAVLNHSPASGSKSGIVGVYQRHEYKEEKIDALTKWSDHLQALVGETAEPVKTVKNTHAKTLERTRAIP